VADNGQRSGDRAAGDQMSGAELVRRLEVVIWLRAGAANLGGAIPLIVLGGVYVRRFVPGYQGLPLFAAGVAMTVVLFLPMWTGLRFWTRRLLKGSVRWIDENRAPSADELHDTATLARRIATFPAPWWASAGVLAVVIIHGLGVAPSTSQLVVGVAGIILGGVVSCGLCYLLAEDALRPLFGLALREGGLPHRAAGLRSRLVAYWLVGSAAYLLGIALILENFPPNIARPIGIVCCALGAVVGFVMTHLSATSITRPLDRLRKAMGDVGRGRLDATVDVDDPGDVGLLQAGFNRMVAGLRERDRLQELFGHHVGPEVVRRALESEAGLAGSERTVSILFVDLIGSTTLAAERPPSAVVAMLNELFAAVVRTVDTEGGFVNQFQGDGALCIFGAPNDVADHAARALNAACTLRKEIERLATVYPGFDAAIGVASGRVVAGDVGTENRYQYTVIGDPANEAARLTTEAKQHPGRVLASEATIKAAGQNGWIACGELPLRGRLAPTVVYEPPR
jgi:adenylate cyclase